MFVTAIYHFVKPVLPCPPNGNSMFQSVSIESCNNHNLTKYFVVIHFNRFAYSIV